MGLPTDLRCQVYEHLLAVEGPHHGIISTDELKFRAVLRKLYRNGLGPLTNERMRELAKDYDLLDQNCDYAKDLLDHDGRVKPLLHVNILRVSRQINDEASDILYGRNTLSVLPNPHKQTEPLHYQFVDGLLPFPVHHLRLDLADKGHLGCKSRATNLV
jgi:hypothetical protein